jgi:hypothetical protein
MRKLSSPNKRIKQKNQAKESNKRNKEKKQGKEF